MEKFNSPSPQNKPERDTHLAASIHEVTSKEFAAAYEQEESLLQKTAAIVGLPYENLSHAEKLHLLTLSPEYREAHRRTVLAHEDLIASTDESAQLQRQQGLQAIETAGYLNGITNSSHKELSSLEETIFTLENELFVLEKKGMVSILNDTERMRLSTLHSELSALYILRDQAKQNWDDAMKDADTFMDTPPFTK